MLQHSYHNTGLTHEVNQLIKSLIFMDTLVNGVRARSVATADPALSSVVAGRCS